MADQGTLLLATASPCARLHEWHDDSQSERPAGNENWAFDEQITGERRASINLPIREDSSGRFLSCWPLGAG